MKSKLGIVFTLMCVASFFLYKMGEDNKSKNTKEDLIEGVIVDASSQKPINGVSIAVAGNNPRSVSDDKGKFLVYGLTTNDYIFKHPNYKSIILPGKDIKLVKMEKRSE